MLDVRKIENLLLRSVQAGLCLLLITPFIVTTSTMYPFVHGKVFYFLFVSEVVFWLYFTLCLINKKYRPGFKGLNFAALLFLAALFLASVFGVNFERSFWGNIPKMLGLFEVIHIFLMFLVLGTLAREKDFRDKFIFAVFLMGVALGILGVIQALVPSFLGTGWGGRRIGVTFDNPDYYGSVVIFPLFFGIYLLCGHNTVPLAARMEAIRAYVGGADTSHKKPAQTYLPVGRYPGLSGSGLFLRARAWKKIIILSGVCLLVFNLYFTQARATIVAASAGIIFVAAYVLFKNIVGSVKISRIKIFAIISLMVLAAGVGMFTLNYSGGGRFSPQTLYRDLTQSARSLAWGSALQGFSARKLFGWGYGNFNVVYDTFYKPEMLRFSHEETRFDSSHNIFLDYLSLGGLVVLAALFYLIFRAGKTIFEIKKTDEYFAVVFGVLSLVYFAQGMLIFDTLFSLFLFFAVLALVASFFGDTRESIYPKMGMWKFTSAIALVFIALIMNGTVIAWGRASAAAHDMSVALNGGAGREAVAFLDVLTKNVGPFNQEYLIDDAAAVINYSKNYSDWETEFSRARAEGLFNELAAAAKNHPGDVRYSSVTGELGIILAQKNSAILEQAKNILRNYLEINPNRQEVYYPLIRLNIISGNLDEAEKLSAKVLLLDDKIRESHYYAAMVAFAGGKDDQGFGELETAIKLGYPIEDSTVMLIGASYWGDRGDYKHVVLFLKRALTVYPESQLYTMLAATEAQLGNKAAAVEAVRHAVILKPSLRPEAVKFLESIGIKVITN